VPFFEARRAPGRHPKRKARERWEPTCFV
jgi:hypothetical protein